METLYRVLYSNGRRDNGHALTREELAAQFPELEAEIRKKEEQEEWLAFLQMYYMWLPNQW